MSSPTLPSRTPGNRNASDSSNSSTNTRTPPIPTPRVSVSASIAKRWPPLATDSPVQPQPRSTTTVSTPPKPKPPAEPTPPLPKRPAEPTPPLPKRPAEPTPPGLPKRPAEPLSTHTQEKGPPLGKRPAEALPPLPSQSEAGPPLPRRPADPLPSKPVSQEALPPVQSQMHAVASLVKSTTIPVLAVANGDLGPESFGQCLQSATDALGKRHENELIALESLRFHIFNRAKQDKAYAEELLKTNMRASKKAASVSDPSSPIFQAWLSYLEMSENVQKQISAGAAQMNSVLLGTVDQLIRDKRGAKTVFDRELAKMDKEKVESCTRVTNLKKEYRHYVKKTETFKDKLEIALAKDPPKPQEQDRARKKFVTSADKLHSTHNEYSLSIVNANRHMEHHRLHMVPFTLDTLQERMQLQIGQWREAMINYAKAVDFTQTYQESFEKLYQCLNAVQQDTEYSSFVQEHKEENPPLEYFSFEVDLLESPTAPKVEAGKIVTNNLTHIAMKSRLSVLEDELEQHEKTIQQKSEELEALKSSGDVNEDSCSVSSPPPPSPTKETGQQPPKHVRIATLNAAIREVQCSVARKQEQAALIKESVEAMAGDTPPMFDPLGEGVDLSELAAASAAEPAMDSGAGRRGTLAWGSTLKNMKSAGSKIKTMFRTKKKTRGPSVSSVEETVSPLTTSVSHDTITSTEETGYESDESTDNYDEPPDIPVEEEEWYFGDIDRRLAENKCKVEGNYMVRYSERQRKYVLTCKYKGSAKHFVIQVFTDDVTGQKQYRFESKAFSKIRFLLDYHTSSGTPVTRQSGAIIIKPISKYDKWELQREEIKIGKKIGKGAFGDVFEATYLRDGRKVAVKTCRSSDLYDMEKFLQEADILKGYQHPNIVSLIGVCTQKDQVYIVMEFMPGGAFLDFLRKKGAAQTKRKLCSMVLDASKGMVYLEEQHCIHRDLAARNCLVGDEDVVKIADFGMSRESDDSEYTVQSGTRAIPIKWTAPEALNYGKYTPASDVWSFGILLWETYSCGSAPYPGMNNQDARMEIENGYRMPPPTDCPQEVYGVMQQCWQYDPEERPDFRTVFDMLQQSFDKIKN